MLRFGPITRLHLYQPLHLVADNFARILQPQHRVNHLQPNLGSFQSRPLFVRCSAQRGVIVSDPWRMFLSLFVGIFLYFAALGNVWYFSVESCIRVSPSPHITFVISMSLSRFNKQLRTPHQRTTIACFYLSKETLSGYWSTEALNSGLRSESFL